MAQVWRWARLGQFIAPTGRCENQDRMQDRMQVGLNTSQDWELSRLG